MNWSRYVNLIQMIIIIIIIIGFKWKISKIVCLQR